MRYVALLAVLLTVACEEGDPFSLKDRPWDSAPEDDEEADPAVHTGGEPRGLIGAIDVEEASALLLGEAEGEEAGRAQVLGGPVRGRRSLSTAEVVITSAVEGAELGRP